MIINESYLLYFCYFIVLILVRKYNNKYYFNQNLRAKTVFTPPFFHKEVSIDIQTYPLHTSIHAVSS